jgi:hypothetical protein
MARPMKNSPTPPLVPPAPRMTSSGDDYINAGGAVR